MKFSREFKFELANLIRDRGVSFTQADPDLDININVLGRRAKELGADPKHALLGLGQMKPEQQEIGR